jgi:hypothetical protein
METIRQHLAHMTRPRSGYQLAARQTPPNRYDSSDHTATSRQMDLQSLAEERHFDDLIDLAEYRFFVTSRSMDL